jgi:hypothetical protein
MRNIFSLSPRERAGVRGELEPEGPQPPEVLK